MAVGIKFLDRPTQWAPTWDDLEQLVRDMQWRRYPTREEFREEMATRALVWSNTEIDIDGDAMDFLFELERAQMLQVIPREPLTMMSPETDKERISI